MRCSALQCVAACCSVLQYVAVKKLFVILLPLLELQCIAVFCSVLQYVAMRCSALQEMGVVCDFAATAGVVGQCIALQRVAVRCSVL